MKYNLQQSIFTQDIEMLISKELKKHKIYLHPLNSKNLEEIAQVKQLIEAHGLPPYFVRKKLDGKLGHGIFLHPDASPLLKGQVIAPYAGEVSLVPQNAPDSSAFAFDLICDIRLKKEDHSLCDPNNKYHPNRFYTLKLDALKKGNFTRFINHSETPNIIAYLVKIPKNKFGISPSPVEVVYFVKKKILPGEQLLVCYEDGEKKYWNSTTGKPFPMTPRTFRIDGSLKLEKSLR